MALENPTNLTSGGNASSVASNTTASITPGAGAILFAVASVGRSSAVSTTIEISSTIGDISPWTEVTIRNAGGQAKISLFYCSVGASPVAGTITFTYSGGSGTIRQSWIVDQMLGADSNVMIDESGTGETTTAALTITLGTIGGNNKVYSAVLSAGASSITVGTGETEILEATSGSTAEARTQTQYGTTKTPDWSGLSTSVGSVGVAVEIREGVLGKFFSFM